MANNVVNRQVNVYINSGEAQKALDKLIAKEKILKDELAKATDPKKIANLNKELAKLQEPIDRATRKVKGELAPSFRELQAAAARAIAEFKKTGDPAMLAQYAKFNAELQKQVELINKANNAQQGLTKKGIFSAAFWANLAAGGIQAATSALSSFFTESVNEALDSERATSQLKNTLDNLGKTEVFDRLVRKADEMAQKFKFLDNDDVVAVFNKLIDYGKLTEQQMNDLLPVIIDFAAKTKQDLGSATEVIIGALEGNGKALKQFGINIKDAGSESERFNEIMTTLKGKVDGAAEAFQESAEGGIKSARQEFKNLQEDLGNEVIPILNQLLSIVLRIPKGLKILSNGIKEVLNGGTGFFSGQQDAILNDEGFQKTVDAMVEERLSAFKALQKNLESNQFGGLGRKLTNSKEDKDLIASQQQSFISNARQQIAAAQKELDFYRKNTRFNNKEDGVEIKALLETIQSRTKLLDSIDALLNGGTLGIPGKGDAGGSKIDKIAEDLKKLNEELRKLKEIDPDLSPFEKEVVELGFKFDELKKLAHGNREKLKEIDEAYYRELFELQVKYARLELEEYDKKDKAIQAKQKAFIDDQTKQVKSNSAEVLRRNTAIITSIFDSLSRDKTAGLQLRILQSTGKDRLKAQLALLEEERNRELANTTLTQNERLLIIQKYKQQELDLHIEFETQKLQKTREFIDLAFSLEKIISDGQTQKENNELARDQRVNDAKKNSLKRRLESGKLTQLQYDREIQKIELAQEKRQHQIAVRQFKRKQRADIADALLNGTLAVLMDLKTIPKVIPGTIIPNPQLPAAIITDAVTTALKVGAALAVKPPEFGGGGLLGGRSHANGGNPIMDGAGNKIAEIEAGEGIINKHSMADGKRYTVSGTPSQIASSINTLHGGVNWAGGATLVPQWRTTEPKQLNYAAMKKAYATGGVFDQGSSAATPVTIDLSSLTAVIDDMRITLDNIQKQGIPAYSLITQQEKQQTRLDNIRADATLKG